jgi:hypothetical protein
VAQSPSAIRTETLTDRFIGLRLLRTLHQMHGSILQLVQRINYDSLVIQWRWSAVYVRSVCLSIYLFIYGFTVSPFFDLGRFFSFLIFYTVGRTPWTGDQPVARPLPAHRTTQTQNKRTQTFMPEVGFELMIPVFDRSKIVHDLDRAATVIGGVRSIRHGTRWEDGHE